MTRKAWSGSPTLKHGFWSRTRNGFFLFINCCEALGIEPGYLRRGLCAGCETELTKIEVGSAARGNKTAKATVPRSRVNREKSKPQRLFVDIGSTISQR